MIVTNQEHLCEPSTDIKSVEEAKEILHLLDREMQNHPNGVGLSAIQIDISKRVALIKYKGERYTLINPTIENTEDEFFHHNEGCLSFPGRFCTVPRFKQITLNNTVFDESAPDGWREERTVHYVGDDGDDLSPIIIQHEVDHMNGILMVHKEIILEPVIVDEKIGRNDPCPCGSGKKYKKCCLKKG